MFFVDIFYKTYILNNEGCKIMDLIKKSIKQGYLATKENILKNRVIDILTILFIVLIIKCFYFFSLNIQKEYFKLYNILFFVFLLYISRLFHLIFYEYLKNKQIKLLFSIKKFLKKSIILLLFEIFYYLYNIFIVKVIKDITLGSKNVISYFSIFFEIFVFLVILVVLFFIKENFMINLLDTKKYFKAIKSSFLAIKYNFIEYLKFFPFFIILNALLMLFFFLLGKFIFIDFDVIIIKILFTIIVFPIFIFYKYVYLFFYYNLTGYPEISRMDFIKKYLVIK